MRCSVPCRVFIGESFQIYDSHVADCFHVTRHIHMTAESVYGNFVDLLLSKGSPAGTFNQILFQETGGFPGGLPTTSLGKPFEIQYIRNDPGSLQRVRVKIIPSPVPCWCLRPCWA